MNITPKKPKSRLKPLKIQARPHLGLKLSPEYNETLKILIQVFEPRMLTKVNPRAKISIISNLGPQILKKTPNLKPTTLLDQFPYIRTDGIDRILFRYSKLQKTLKLTS